MSKSAALGVLLNRLKTTKEYMVVTSYALVSVASAKTPSGKGSHHRAVTNHAIKRSAENAIQLLYTQLSEYLKLLLTEMYSTRPYEVAGKAQGSLKFYEIIKLGSYEAISKHIVDQVFRTLESEKNTKLLLKKLLANTRVNIPADVLNEAMMYLEIRHLIVHNASVVDDKFARTYTIPAFHPGGKLPISVGLAKSAIKSIEHLCAAIDEGLVREGYLKAVEYDPPQRQN